MALKEISKPVHKELETFNKVFKDSMKSDVSLLNLIIAYLTRKRGKQIRPTLVLLAAKACGGITDRSYTGAAMTELLHNATLIHDDVVDEATERRGMASINEKWNNKISVLIGDYLLGKGLLTAIDTDEFDFLRALSTAVKRMSEGELLQIQKSKDFDTDEDTYFRIIGDKTASLLSACCEIGAISADADMDTREIFRQFGENIGLAFQIRDDVFDYQGSSSLIGKPVGNDLKEKKLTLPLIYSFRHSEKRDSKKILGYIKSGNLSKDKIKEIANFVNTRGGIKYSEEKSSELSRKAVDLLSPVKDSDAKESLISLAEYVINRKR